MSYCRFSTNDFKCDIYLYEDCSGGWTIHVAKLRTVKECPSIDYNSSIETIVQQSKTQHEFLQDAERKEIGLPHDGLTLNCCDIEDVELTLIMLRAEGYNFPDYVLDVVADEKLAAIAEEASQDTASQDMASQDTKSQDTKSQDTKSQDTKSQDTKS